MVEAFAPFKRVVFVGIGLIGGSLALAMRRHGLAERCVAADASPEHGARAVTLGLVDEATTDLIAAVRGADFVMLCVPVGAMGAVAAMIGPHLEPGCLVSDTGSVKQAVIQAVAPHMPSQVCYVPGHPLAGTEHSGPDAAFAELFAGRWCILTPLPDTETEAVRRLRAMWEAVGAQVNVMEPGHHDRVLAITSHLPHLIAYTAVGTAADLEGDLQQEVIRYSASGFHDFTRVAASDPVMWRDIFLNNRDAVLEIIQRFQEDLTALQRAIRWGEGEALQRRFEQSRAIRRGIVTAGQAEPLASRAPGTSQP